MTDVPPNNYTRQNQHLFPLTDEQRRRELADPANAHMIWKRGDPNPFDPSTPNLTKQMVLIRLDRAQAERLCHAVGVPVDF